MSRKWHKYISGQINSISSSFDAITSKSLCWWNLFHFTEVARTTQHSTELCVVTFLKKRWRTQKVHFLVTAIIWCWYSLSTATKASRLFWAVLQNWGFTVTYETWKIIRENFFFLVNKSCFSYLHVLTYSGIRIRHFMRMGVESFQVKRLFLVKSNYFWEWSSMVLTEDFTFPTAIKYVNLNYWA